MSVEQADELMLLFTVICFIDMRNLIQIEEVGLLKMKPNPIFLELVLGQINNKFTVELFNFFLLYPESHDKIYKLY
jgi:hypothetical protein